MSKRASKLSFQESAEILYDFEYVFSCVDVHFFGTYSMLAGDGANREFSYRKFFTGIGEGQRNTQEQHSADCNNNMLGHLYYGIRVRYSLL